MNKTKIVTIMLALLLICSAGFARTDLRVRPFQLSLGYPLGTNGINALEYSNVLSMNLLYGINGGLDGVEVGATFNYIHQNANGVQISGVSNIVRRYSNGIFVTGAANLHFGPVKGVDVAGGLNLSGGHADGFFVAGGANIHLRTLDGVSIAGGLNMAAGDAEGFTIAPVNLFLQDYFGVQIGVVNMVNRMDGLQVGVVNIVNDGTEALPIGLVSVVRNGYFELEVNANELSYLNANFKMGVSRFYNVYSVGYSVYEGLPVYRFGLGIGTSQPVRYRHRVAFELLQQEIIYNWNWNNGLNMLTRFGMDYRMRIGDSFTIVLGPSCNAMLTNQKVNDEYGTLNIPKTFYEQEWTNSKLFMWFGWKLGFSYLL